MVRPDDLHLFVRVAALGSFSLAAREADLLPGQVSVAIQRLEQRLDSRLFARTTRSLRLTAEGEKYLPYAQEILDVMQAGQESLRSHSDELRGLLRIALPSDCGRRILLPWISEFAQQHGGLRLQLSLSDQVSDVFRDPVDIAVRYGDPGNNNYVARPLALSNRRVLVASPKYLAEHGQPQHPDDLYQHHCLHYTLGGQLYDKWTFSNASGSQTVQVGSRWQCDDADVVRRWAVAGYGITYKSQLDISEDVAAGRLAILLSHYQGEAAPLYLICPHRKQFSPAIRLLYQHLSDKLTTLRMEEKVNQLD